MDGDMTGKRTLKRIRTETGVPKHYPESIGAPEIDLDIYVWSKRYASIIHRCIAIHRIAVQAEYARLKTVDYASTPGVNWNCDPQSNLLIKYGQYNYGDYSTYNGPDQTEELYIPAASFWNDEALLAYFTVLKTEVDNANAAKRAEIEECLDQHDRTTYERLKQKYG